MKFKIGDHVRKTKGYKFEGIIIGAGYKLSGDRILYMVEIPNFATNEDFDKQNVQNCGGMVHIFAEQDLEII